MRHEAQPPPFLRDDLATKLVVTGNWYIPRILVLVMTPPRRQRRSLLPGDLGGGLRRALGKKELGQR
jgi:hypothetical protein